MISDVLVSADATIAIQSMGIETIPPSTLPREVNARPDPQWTRGRCPQCGGLVVSSLVWFTKPTPGYAIVWECWNRRHVEGSGQTILTFDNEAVSATSMGTGWARCDYMRIL